MTYTSTRLTTIQAIFSKKTRLLMSALHILPALSGSLLLLVTTGCQSMAGQVAPRKGDEIVVAGQMIHSGTPVTLWIGSNHGASLIALQALDEK